KNIYTLHQSIYLQNVGIGNEGIGNEGIGNEGTNNNNINNNNINNNNTNKDTVGKSDDTIPYKLIIDYLNEKANKKFKQTTGKYQSLIKSRWNEGQRVDDFKQVIDNMVAEWTGTYFSDGKPAENYLQPSTLFGPKFDQYLNTVPKK